VNEAANKLADNTVLSSFFILISLYVFNCL